MSKYTVIWRQNQDDYLLTEVYVDAEEAQDMGSNDWADLAAETELRRDRANGDWDESDEPYQPPSETGYDLIAVIDWQAGGFIY